jgi:hypothetical protein
MNQGLVHKLGTISLATVFGTDPDAKVAPLAFEGIGEVGTDNYPADVGLVMNEPIMVLRGQIGEFFKNNWRMLGDIDQVVEVLVEPRKVLVRGKVIFKPKLVEQRRKGFVNTFGKGLKKAFLVAF